ncbi:MAG: peptide-methionine (S)-S-oxide reductase [Rhizobiales bacterium 65-79]|jgi:peptide-methionine (S)-S-oxide reductase|nr:peptide-methionine (S)-S-oxide reductase MsrA [Hyphomicrobiales bacterium]OJU01474.1 MAG: peptide-methionine (S)-S-oxide reductase [Rhizobiales bacterium 65-79]
MLRSLAAAFVFASTAVLSLAAPAAAETQTAIFAGGCFWCVESDFDHVPGVTSTTSGYTGGHVKDPTYQQVVTETTGHRESEKIEFDTSKTSYAKLLDVYFHATDPTDGGGQFCDRGESYTPAIFYLDDEQRKEAEAAKAAAAKELGQPVVTKILPASAFYPAEDYHQDYYLKNPLRYKYYRYGCGRDARLEELWGKKARRGIEE